MLTKENLSHMCAKNTEAISVYASILEGKVSTLNAYNNGISDIMGDYPNLQKTHIQEDSEALRDLLDSICHNGPEGSLEAVQGKIDKSQYSGFLHGLRELIATEVPLYQKSNLAIARKLAELAD